MTRYTTHVPYPPQMRAFQPPNSDQKIDLDKYHKVILFGDSNMKGLWRDNNEAIKNLHFLRQPDSALQGRSMKRLFLPKIQWLTNVTMYEDDNPDFREGDKVLPIRYVPGGWDIICHSTKEAHEHSEFLIIAYSKTEHSLPLHSRF